MSKMVFGQVVHDRSDYQVMICPASIFEDIAGALEEISSVEDEDVVKGDIEILKRLVKARKVIDSCLDEAYKFDEQQKLSCEIDKMPMKPMKFTIGFIDIEPRQGFFKNPFRKEGHVPPCL